MKHSNGIIILFLLVIVCACNKQNKLPILGNRYAETKIIDGKEVTDTIYQQVPAFRLVNQDGDMVTEQLTTNKIYVADFFFTTCPTICPVMKKEMSRVYEEFKGHPDFMILSHTIDPEHDQVDMLKQYATGLGSDGIRWQFLTGNRDSIYRLAETGYYTSARADSLEPGGFIHSGGFILVDKKKRVRGVYDGTSSVDVDRLISDIYILADEKD